MEVESGEPTVRAFGSLVHVETARRRQAWVVGVVPRIASVGSAVWIASSCWLPAELSSSLEDSLEEQQRLMTFDCCDLIRLGGEGDLVLAIEGKHLPHDEGGCQHCGHPERGRIRCDVQELDEGESHISRPH